MRVSAIQISCNYRLAFGCWLFSSLLRLAERLPEAKRAVGGGDLTGNDAYITAYNSQRNAAALSALHGDLGFLDKFLSRDVSEPHGMMWIGPPGTFTPLHHDLTDNFIAQIVGRKRLKLVPAPTWENSTTTCMFLVKLPISRTCRSSGRDIHYSPTCGPMM